MSCASGVWLVLRQTELLRRGCVKSYGVVFKLVIMLRIRRRLAVGMESLVESLHSCSYPVLAGSDLDEFRTALVYRDVAEHGECRKQCRLGSGLHGLFALGLFLGSLCRWGAHLDANCVLFGQLVHAVLDTVNTESRSWQGGVGERYDADHQW
ncbi:MAG: hypothetical protein R3C01_13175 [Planctomycetaceae bacterium]